MNGGDSHGVTEPVHLEPVASTSKDTPQLCTDKDFSRAVKISDCSENHNAECGWRRQCGCLRTSDKLKHLLKCFPAPPPPPPSPFPPSATAFENTCISAYCTNVHQPMLPEYLDLIEKHSERLLESTKKSTSNKSWRVVGELVQLIQLSVTATALAFYYIIYCYMQMVYYTLRSAMFFHNADGPMKITIGVVTLTSLIVGFNVILRMERMIGIRW